MDRSDRAARRHLRSGCPLLDDPEQAASGVAARYFNRAVNLGIVAALAIFLGALLEADRHGGVSVAAGFAVVTIAAAFFSRGMQLWLAEWDNRRVLGTWWRRAEMTCWIAAVAVLPVVILAGWLAANDRSTADTPSGTVGGMLITVVAITGLACLGGMGITASATRESLQEHQEA